MILAALAGGAVLFLLVRVAAGRRLRPTGEASVLRTLGGCALFALGLSALWGGAVVATLVAGVVGLALTLGLPSPRARRIRIPARLRRAAPLGVGPRPSV